MKGEGKVKVPCPFVHAGTTRKPLFTGTFTISGEGEGYFFNSQRQTLTKPKSPRLSMNTKNRGIWWMSRRIFFSKRIMLLVHVLCMTGITNDDGVLLYGVGIVPSVGVGHVTVFPPAKSWPTTR